MQNLLILAHFLIGFYFVFYGFWNIYHWIPILEVMAKRGIPHPYFLLPLGILLQVIAGFMIIFNLYAVFAALALIPFTIIVVMIFHPFWIYRGELRILNLSIFLANMTVTLGALLLIVVPTS